MKSVGPVFGNAVTMEKTKSYFPEETKTPRKRSECLKILFMKPNFKRFKHVWAPKTVTYNGFYGRNEFATRCLSSCWQN